MGVGPRRVPVRPALSVALATLIVALSVAPAHAATSPSPTPSPSSSTSSEAPAQTKPTPEDLAEEIARYIPYKSTATAVGAEGLATATLAIPAGLVPVVLKGRLTSIADNPGIVRIRIGTSIIEMDATTGGDFNLPVPPDSVVDRNLIVEVRNTLDLPDEECVYDSTTTETIDHLELGFIGRETPPTTLAGFFSAPVHKVTIVSPASSLADAEATLSAAGSLARRYDQTVELVVMGEAEFNADPANLVDTDGPNRIVRLIPNSADTVTVTIDNPGVPRLTLAGPGPALSKAASSLESIGLGLAAVPVASELAEQETSTTVGQLTLAELGATKPTLSGLGRITYVLAVPQDRFGGPIQSVAVHLEGVHTPVGTDASATASILWNDQLVSSQLMEDGDQYSTDVTVQPSLMSRDNFLTIRVDAISDSGGCSGGSVTQQFQLDIDGAASTITATPGQSLQPGFVRFPQALGTNLRVAFGSGPVTPELVEAGASLVASLQRAASRSLRVTCEDFPTFIAASYPGVVVGATPSDAAALRAPLRFEPWRAVNFEVTEFTVRVDGPFAALEAFSTAGRDVLLLGGTDPPEQSAPLVTLLADEAVDGLYGWFGLKGNVLVAQPNAVLLPLTTGTVIPQDSTLADSRAVPLWWIVGIGIVVVVLLARLVTLWRRKRRIDKQVSEADGAPVADPGP